MPTWQVYTFMKDKILQTVVETLEFIRQAKDCIDDGSKQDFINYIAQNPLAGDLIPGTGGTRKIRWTSNNHKGKRGGARIIYYYYDETVPIFLLTAYGKNQKANLTMKEKNILHVIVKQIVDLYRGESYE
jgi:mRNA-degrading endonuclease RelE of RelBE toxin-antitoxin system